MKHLRLASQPGRAIIAMAYAPSIQWDEELPDVIGWGATILQTKETLDRASGDSASRLAALSSGSLR